MRQIGQYTKYASMFALRKFSDSMEMDYQSEMISERLVYWRFTLIFGAALVLLFSVWDAAFFPDHFRVLLTIRLLMIAPLLLGAARLAIGNKPARSFWVQTYLVSMTWECAMGVTVMMAYADKPLCYYVFFPGVMIAILYMTVLIVDWVFVFVSGIFTLASYVIFSLVDGMPLDVLGMSLFFLSGAFFVSVISSYVVERFKRDSFASRKENEKLLAQVVQEKTAAEQANVAKSKFLAAASHDLRQPLHALGLFASALDERIKYPEVRGLVTKINQSVSALEGLFNALLDISRLDAGIILPELQNFSFKTLMDRLAVEFAADANHKGLSMRVLGDEVTVYSDPVLLETMMRNLLSNAIRFTYAGEVMVGWVVEEARVRIEVRDTGVGIPEEDMGNIFQEFLQLNNPERDRTKGLGLGLAIVRRLAGLLDCSVIVQSKVGLGSVFQLSIPLGDATLISDGKALLLQELEHEPSMLVLVIDDENTVLEAMTALLANWGHEVVAVGSLNEAMQTLKRAPQAIIVDYRLRENQTGIEAIQRIQDVWGSDIPSMIVTGDTAPERLREAQNSGYLLMSKPVNAAKLRAFLRTVSRQYNQPN